MSAKHTPGPWEVDGQYVQPVDQTILAICDVLNMDVGGDKGWQSGPVTQANKRLIAAAPDLLAACEAAWNCIAELPPTQARVEVGLMLTSAIVKAKGEQQ